MSGRRTTHAGWARHAEKRSADLLFRPAASPQFATKSRAPKQQVALQMPDKTFDMMPRTLSKMKVHPGMFMKTKTTTKCHSW